MVIAAVLGFLADWVHAWLRRIVQVGSWVCSVLSLYSWSVLLILCASGAVAHRPDFEMYDAACKIIIAGLGKIRPAPPSDRVTWIPSKHLLDVIRE